MSGLLVDFIISLDGFGAAEGWPGFWGLQGPEYMAWLGEDSAGEYTTLMGANTYLWWLLNASIAPAACVNPVSSRCSDPTVQPKGARRCFSND
jgi:hypothetical protein